MVFARKNEAWKENKMRNVITISRETGSGGHTIGMMLAKRLGYSFYDAEIMEKLSQELGTGKVLDDEHMSTDDEFNMLAGFVPFKPFARTQKVNFEEINRLQKNMIRNLAKDGNCIIVGRNADYVLRNDPRCFHIFVHADMGHRVQRVKRHENGIDSKGEVIFSGGAKVAVSGEKESEMEARIRRELELKDRTRAANYEYFTGRTWGKVDNYNLMLDTGVMTKTDACDIIVYTLNRIDGGQKNA